VKKDLFLTIGLFVAVCLFAAMFYTYVFLRTGIYITIRNDSDESVDAFYLTYDGIEEDFEVPSLRPGETFKIHFDSRDFDSNTQFSAYYVINEDERVEIDLVGWIGPKDTVRSTLTFLERDLDGTWSVVEDRKLFW
jgi:hypothetical protein